MGTNCTLLANGNRSTFLSITDFCFTGAGSKISRFGKDEFLAKYANDTVRVGDHPYPTQFGLGQRGMETVTLGNYIASFGDHKSADNSTSVKYLWSVHFVAEHIAKVIEDVQEVYDYIDAIDRVNEGISAIPVRSPHLHCCENENRKSNDSLPI